MSMIWTIEYVEELLPHYGQADAQQMLDWLRDQETYLGGRLLSPPVTPDQGWRVQTFFQDTPEAQAGLPLPDGVNRRLTPTALLD
jgi:hypothetical protein